MKFYPRCVAVVAFLLSSVPITTQAQTITVWNAGGAANDVLDANNWDSGVPGFDGMTPGNYIGVINGGNTVTLTSDASGQLLDTLRIGATSSGASSLNGTFNIGSGGTLVAYSLSYGADSGATGTGTISNGGVFGGVQVLVGDSGTGNLSVSSGGYVDPTITVGNSVGGTGTLLVTGSGSSVYSINGGAGTASITVTDSASVGASGIVGGTGNATITINNGAVVNGALSIGDHGAGTSSFAVGDNLGTTAEHRATLTDASIYVVAGAGGTATGTITGGSHTVLEIEVGGGGTNTLTARDGAILDGSGTSSLSRIGLTGGSATFTLTGSGTSWTSGGEIFVGESGAGTLNIQNGAAVSSGSNQVYVGKHGSTGTINVSDSSTFTNGGLHVGYDGTGTVNITNSSVLTTTGTAGLGASASGNGTVTVSGSTWNLTNAGSTLEVGSAGTGSLVVSGGGTVTNAGTFTIGAANGSHGSVTVTGSGSSLTTAFGVTLSPSSGANGSLTLTDGGLFTVGHGILSLGQAAGGTATLNIGGNASQSAAAPGTLVFTDVDPSAAPTYGVIRSAFGTGTLVFNHTSSNYTFGARMDLGVNLYQKAGTTILTGGTDAFGLTGTTTITGGTLRLGVDNAIGSGALTLGGGTLDLNDFNQTAGALTVAGDSFLDFTGTSALTLADSSAIGWNGTLTVLNFDAGDSFRVGTTAGGLTSAQLNSIIIGGYLAQIDASGYLSASSTLAVPEPSTYAALAGVAALGLAALHRRRRHQLAVTTTQRF